MPWLSFSKGNVCATVQQLHVKEAKVMTFFFHLVTHYQLIWVCFFLLFGSGHDRIAKSNSKKEERKMESLPLKPERLRRNWTASQDVNCRKSKSCQAQNTLQFSLPLLPQAKNRQPAAKYQDVYWSPSSSANEGP